MPCLLPRPPAQDESWDQISRSSTVISQWKMTGGIPHAAIRLSNMGDYRLTFRGVEWDGESDEGVFIGYAKPRAWNDVKVFAKMSLGSDGIFKVWLDGKLVFEHFGRNSQRNNYGYMQFGIYTEVYDERTIYFDAVEISNYLTVPLDAWVSDQTYMPTVSLTAPANASNPGSGSQLTVRATAHDPSGLKFRSSGSIQQVEFFADNCSIGVANAPPYEVSPFVPPDGPYRLTAAVTDGDGNIAVSAPFDINVGSYPPDVSLSVAHRANFPLGQTTALSAVASDPDGTVVHVDFFVGQTLLATVPTQVDATYATTWQPSQSGLYQLRAVATDNGGNAFEHSVSVTVGATVQAISTTVTDDASLQIVNPTSVGNWGLVEAYGGASKISAIFKFGLSHFSGAAEVRQAIFRVYVRTMTGPGVVIVSAASSESWSDSTVTWSNGPRQLEGRLTQAYIDQTDRWYEMDVTSLIAERHARGDTEVTLWLASRGRKFEVDSRTRSNPAELVVSTSTIAVSTIPYHGRMPSLGCEQLTLASPPAFPPAPPSGPSPQQPPPSPTPAPPHPSPPPPPPLLPPDPSPPLPSPTPSLPPAPSPLPFAPPLPPSPPPLPSSPKRCPTSIPANTILGQYFDIAAGSVNGSWVSGRLNPKANRNWRTEPLASWSFTLIEDANGLIEVINERDTEGRLFGGLRVSDGRTLGGAGDDVELVAELYRSNELVGCHAFRVHVLEQTVMSVIRQRVLDYALTENHMWGRNQPSESSISSMASSVVSSSGRLPGAPSMHLKVLYRPPRRPKASST